MKVALFGKYFNEGFFSAFQEIVSLLKQKEIEIVFYKELSKFLFEQFSYNPSIDGTFSNHNEIKNKVDYLLSIGGDGTFLDAVSIVREADILIAGINSGRLGFLSDIAQKEVKKAIIDIIKKKFVVEERSLLQLHSPDNIFNSFNCALNELAISKKDTSSMIKIHVWLDDKFLNTYWSDGLIVATPTGSTAYSMSAGGPILAPANQNFIISPISPHNLTVRPIVVPDNLTIRLKVEGRSKEFIASLDSRYESLPQGTELVVKKAGFSIKLLKRKADTFYNTLRNKLMWGMDKRN